jgi:hypothetical protein
MISIQLVAFNNDILNAVLVLMAVLVIMRMAAYIKNMIPFI